MRAVVFDRYGPPEVLRVVDVEPPVPKAHEVLVRVHATTVNRTDTAIRSGENLPTRLGYSYVTTGNPFKGLRHPTQRILGSEFAGEIEAVGPAVSGFRAGDRVFGVNAGRLGAHAEFLCMQESAPITRVPTTMELEDAAAVCDGATLALGCLRKVRLRSGQKILIYGASGSIGTAGVQLAKHHLDADVTAVCTAENVELVASLGADRVIDYLQEDFTRSGERYDVIFDAVGKLPFGRCRGSLAPGGRYIPTDGWSNAFWTVWTAWSTKGKVVLDIPPSYRKEVVLFLKELIEGGNYRAVIDRRYPLDQVVEATRYVETRQKTGNVVLTVS
jgi:NADPH:quinone reductase-like Zn-dependent oxidoreductase